ncbi:zinc-ribbon domain-containing protein [Candidatus Pelagibacter sp.]|nr:zinc-ribbon domain-containing protein [Candidatus Pelagibacter sp.]
MIITCPNCKKKFQIDLALLPEEGRDLQCGVCQHVWFYKIENENSSPLTLNQDFVNKEVEDNLVKEDIIKTAEDKKSIIDEKPKINENKTKTILDNEKDEIKKENEGGKFFSYLIVLIISLVALIILLDTLKTPIINVFPGVEIILFNLFETLKDIKLFIIDLY